MSDYSSVSSTVVQTFVLHRHASYKHSNFLFKKKKPKTHTQHTHTCPRKRVLVDRANYVKGKPLPADLSTALDHTPEADRMWKQVCHIWLIKANRAELSPEDEIQAVDGPARRPACGGG